MDNAKWAVFFSKAWGQPDARQQSIPLPKREAAEHMAMLRKMEIEFPMGRRYRMRKLPNQPITCPTCGTAIDPATAGAVMASLRKHRGGGSTQLLTAQERHERAVAGAAARWGGKQGEQQCR